MKHALALVVGSLWLSSCATQVNSLRLPVVFTDHPSERRVEVAFQNNSAVPICLAAEDWPSNSGDLHESSDVVYLLVQGKKFPIRNMNRGYCKGDPCTIRIQPGERIAGSMPYENFDLPESAASAQKELVFAPPAFGCR
jgi:hypothetical protein